MSQSSLQQDALEWTQQECQQNWESALPGLTQNFPSGSDSDITDLLKLLCQSFVPVVPLDQLETSVFSQIADKVKDHFSHVLEQVDQLIVAVHQHRTEAQQALVSALQQGLEVLNCLESCVSHLSGLSDVHLADVHSLPPVVVHCLYTSYTHCKDSSATYGDLLGIVSEQLTCLFKTAHSLQMSFIGLLDKVSVSPTEQDVEDMCQVIQGLHELSQVAVSLDIKIMVTLWKTISRLACQHKDLLCNRLDLGPMLSALSQEMCSSYDYIFQLVPRQNQTGDEKAFLKQVKVLGFQMKVLMMLLKEYLGYHGNCLPSIYKLILAVQRSVPPALASTGIPTQYTGEVQKQVTAGVEPLLSSLVTETDFINCVLAEKQDIVPDLQLPRCLTLCYLLNIIPTTSDRVQQRWIAPTVNPEDEPRLHIVKALFATLMSCYVELQKPVKLPGVMCHGKPLREVSLYEHVCTQLCAFVACYPAVHFKTLERCLLETVLNRATIPAMLAIDVWCFLARYGSAELCSDHVHFLTRLLVQSGVAPSSECCHLIVLLRRLINFLAPDDQTKFAELFPASDQPQLWSVLPLSVLPGSVLEQGVQTLVTSGVSSIDNWVNGTERTATQAVGLSTCLRCLKNIYQHTALVEQHVGPEHNSTVLNKTMELSSTLPVTSVAQSVVLQSVTSSWLELCACLVVQFDNVQILEVVRLMYMLLLEDPDTSVKLAVLSVMAALGKIQLQYTEQQAEILQLLAQIFSTLLADCNSIVHQGALQTFAQFAEETVHESVVPDSLQHGSQLQETVVNYLNKLANGSAGDNTNTTFLQQQQHRVLDIYHRLGAGQAYRAASWREAETTRPQTSTSEEHKPLAKKPRTDVVDTEKTPEYQPALSLLQQGVASLQQLNHSNSVLPDWVLLEIQTVYRQLGSLLKPPS